MSVDTTTLLRTLLERAHTISRDASLQELRVGDAYYTPLLKTARFLALDIQELDQQLRAGCPLPEPWLRHPAGGTR